MQDYGEQVAFLGEWGRFQVLVFSLLCLCMLPNGIVSFCSVFLADTPKHHCFVPEVNLTQEWLNASIPTQVSTCRPRPYPYKTRLLLAFESNLVASQSGDKPFCPLLLFLIHYLLISCTSSINKVVGWMDGWMDDFNICAIQKCYTKRMRLTVSDVRGLRRRYETGELQP